MRPMVGGSRGGGLVKKKEEEEKNVRPTERDSNSLEKKWMRTREH